MGDVSAEQVDSNGITESVPWTARCFWSWFLKVVSYCLVWVFCFVLSEWHKSKSVHCGVL